MKHIPSFKSRRRKKADVITHTTSYIESPSYILHSTHNHFVYSILEFVIWTEHSFNFSLEIYLHTRTHLLICIYLYVLRIYKGKTAPPPSRSTDRNPTLSLLKHISNIVYLIPPILPCSAISYPFLSSQSFLFPLKSSISCDMPQPWPVPLFSATVSSILPPLPPKLDNR